MILWLIDYHELCDLLFAIMSIWVNQFSWLFPANNLGGCVPHPVLKYALVRGSFLLWGWLRTGEPKLLIPENNMTNMHACGSIRVQMPTLGVREKLLGKQACFSEHIKKTQSYKVSSELSQKRIFPSQISLPTTPVLDILFFFSLPTTFQLSSLNCYFISIAVFRLSSWVPFT